MPYMIMKVCQNELSTEISTCTCIQTQCVKTDLPNMEVIQMKLQNGVGTLIVRNIHLFQKNGMV